MTRPARLRFHLARRLDGLPSSWQLRLARAAPATLDGLTLDPGLQLLLALRRRRLVELASLSPAAARRLICREAAAGPLPARHYTPAEPGPHPLLLYLHGGGFVLCDLDTHDQVLPGAVPPGRRAGPVGGLPAGARASVPGRGR